MISGHSDLRDAYRDQQVAREYVGRRFQSAMGALLHRRQVEVVRRAIEVNGVQRAAEIAPGPARVSVDISPLRKASRCSTPAGRCSRRRGSASAVAQAGHCSSRPMRSTFRSGTNSSWSIRFG